MNTSMRLPPPDSFANRLKLVRLLRFASQEALAKTLSVPRAMVHRWETGTEPRTARVQAIAEALHVAPQWLAYGIGEGPQGMSPINNNAPVEAEASSQAE